MVCGNSNLEADDQKLFNKCKNCIEQENYIKGEKLFKKFAKTELARLHPEMEFESIQGIATCHLKLGKHDSAIQLSREVLAKRLAFYRNENHHFVLNSETNLATALLQSRVDVVEAEKILRSCYEKKKRILGENHIDTITCRNSLEMALVYQRKFDEAKKFEMDLSQKTDFSNTKSLHQYIITSHNQGISLMRQNRYLEAKSLMTKGLAMSVETLGENDVLTASFEQGLGNCLRNLNELKEAQIYLRSCLRKRKGLLGKNSYDTLLSMLELGRTLRLQGQFDEAESHLSTFLKAMEKQNQLHESAEENVFMGKKLLTEIYIERRDFKKAESLLTDTIECVYNKFDSGKK
jgi:tetratricopeptide (TPR) repeat protein